MFALYSRPNLLGHVMFVRDTSNGHTHMFLGEVRGSFLFADTNICDLNSRLVQAVKGGLYSGCVETHAHGLQVT